MKLAILCGGKSQLNDEEPLKGIENSLKDVRGVLHKNGWYVVPYFITTTEDDFKKQINNYIKEKGIETSAIKDILFFYTGHGVYGDSYSQENFRMVWDEQDISVASIVRLLNETLKTHEHKTKIGLIIDACYSGDVLIERKRDRYIEILTSTQAGEKTYEKTFDGRIKSIFSYVFTKIFELPNQNEKITIRDIGNFINNNYEVGSVKDISEELKVYYGESLDNNSIEIGNNKEVNDVKEIIKEYYTSDVDKLKKDFLSYHLLDALSFSDISNCNDFDTLLQYLFQESDCLYCILKKIARTNPYLNKLNAVNCEERKSENELNKIIFLVGTNLEYDCSKKYDIDLYFLTKKQRVRYIKTVKEVDFNTENKYGEIICDSISNIEALIVSSTAVEITLILPNDLHDIDFSKIICDFAELKSEYDILIQSQIRYVHIDNAGIYKYIARWKKNSAKYTLKQNETISDEYLYKISNNAGCNTFGKQYIREGSNYVCLVSEISLISHIETIVNFGLPIVVFPRDGSCDMISTIFKIKKIKYSFLKYISDNGENHYFMYDLYDEVKELKKQITKLESQVEYI
jgi:TusA-related sulfurtransferase